MSSRKLFSLGRNFACWVVLIAVTMFTGQARAAFHLWSITEIYSNSSGTLQFIELTDSSGGQNLVGGQQIQVHNLGNTLTNTFTLGSGSLSGSTAGHSLLFATAGAQAAGAPAADYILPNGFLFQAGGSITFFGLNGGGYTSLPIDGIMSRTWTGGNAVNSPRNFAGQTGTIVPGPATLALVTGGGWLLVPSRRRSRAAGR